jgi:hypothetical protein
MDVLAEIKDLLLTFIKEINHVVFNERNLQLYLASRLEKTGRFEEVHMEYHLPKGFNEEFDKGYEAWKTEQPSIDIVLKIKGEDKYIAIELKNKLKSFEGECSRFGQTVTGVKLVKDQSAQNIGRYQFWKDVKRLELLKESYVNVIGGIALFLTNDDNYLNTTSGADYEAFGMSCGIPSRTELDWKEPYKMNKDGNYVKDKKGNKIRKSPSIKLNKGYIPEWKQEIFTISNNVKFHCCTVLV